MSRGVWRIFAVALPLLPADAGCARAARFLRRPRARDRAARIARRVRAEPVSVGGADTATSSWTNSRIRAERSGSSCRCSFAAGVKALARLRRHPAVDIRRRRPEAVDLRLPRRGCLRDRRRSGLIAALRPDGHTKTPFRSSFRAAPELQAFRQRRVFRHRRPRRREPVCIPVRRVGSISAGCGWC